MRPSETRQDQVSLKTQRFNSSNNLNNNTIKEEITSAHCQPIRVTQTQSRSCRVKLASAVELKHRLQSESRENIKQLLQQHETESELLSDTQHITGNSWQVTAASSSSYAPETCTHRWGATTDDITQDAEAPPPRKSSSHLWFQTNKMKLNMFTLHLHLGHLSDAFIQSDLQ